METSAKAAFDSRTVATIWVWISAVEIMTSQSIDQDIENVDKIWTKLSLSSTLMQAEQNVIALCGTGLLESYDVKSE